MTETIERVGRTLPFSCEQVFGVAADIERYPDFLRLWISAIVTRREDNRLTVQQVLGLGLVRLRFVSHAVIDRPRSIQVTSEDNTFREFRLCITVSPDGATQSRIGVRAALVPRSLLMQRLVAGILGSSLTDMIDAFETRIAVVVREADRVRAASVEHS
jgi:coenzyme Q-binding protein COQ10